MGYRCDERQSGEDAESSSSVSSRRALCASQRSVAGRLTEHSGAGVACPSRPLTEYGSTDAVVSFIAGDARASIVRTTLAAGGRIGRHAGRRSQLFVVVEGSGRVRADGGEPIELTQATLSAWKRAKNTKRR